MLFYCNGVTMSLDQTVGQIFSWTLQLTSQKDYQELTYCFLGILAEIPWIDNAVAYEIYNHDRKKPGESSVFHERLFRRFPVDITRNDQDDNNNLANLLDQNADLNFSAPFETGLYSWVIFSIKGGSGPDRAIFLEGKFGLDGLDLLNNLRSAYRNLVILHDAKERDALTKLPNRQSLEARLLQVCELYRNYQAIDIKKEQSSWLAILDIDHFKRINDNFGHLYGDEVLLTFSQLMGKCFRYNDFLFRYGGEEFVVILNLINQDHAIAAFNRFREKVAKHIFPTVGQVTVSIGLMHLDSISMPTTQLDHADKALYHAKETGRNKVILYEDMHVIGHDKKRSDIELF
ncbi:diguanylate cyclase [Methyloglobulus morosus KoM1]|uniref:diguanylate cyclase n=2 Tax=Methyloglobulus TaxID=1410680 RepID=V5B0V4_9GAMM|nr:diguanylate cyclase [Methyloglobulus morosus KoM1]